ncbi:MAG TPA: hypothetical protein VNE62_06055 [Actinomycetota bacterium]|nr:hypothetical protein [Actinomycetota bacterium]
MRIRMLCVFLAAPLAAVLLAAPASAGHLCVTQDPGVAGAVVCAPQTHHGQGPGYTYQESDSGAAVWVNADTPVGSVRSTSGAGLYQLIGNGGIQWRVFAAAAGNKTDVYVQPLDQNVGSETWAGVVQYEAFGTGYAGTYLTGGTENNLGSVGPAHAEAFLGQIKGDGQCSQFAHAGALTGVSGDVAQGVWLGPCVREVPQMPTLTFP